MNQYISGKKLYVQTFGCQMNELDSEKMQALLEKNGYELTTQADFADVVLINTCSIREKAEHKLYSLLGRFKDRPGTTIGVTGCVAQQEGKELFKKFPYLNLVMGPDAIPKIVELLEKTSEKRHVLDTDVFDGLEYPFVNDIPNRDGLLVSTFVTIQKGCDNKCTFCIVPKTRGEERSRPSDDIINEIINLTDRGVKEVTLLGQNVNSYGLKDGDQISFAKLLYKISERVPKLERIRFTTSHPRDLPDELIQAFADLPKLSPYFHLPVQSGSNKILKRMKRYYTIEAYLDRIEKLRKASPKIVFSTDFIVGFPGETRADFDETLNLLKQVHFDSSFSFVYSPRPDTPALKLKDDVPDPEKKERLLELQEIQRDLSLKANEKLVGSVLNILVEGHSRNSQNDITGRSEENKTVNFPGMPRLISQIVPVKITHANMNSLRGEIFFPETDV